MKRKESITSCIFRNICWFLQKCLFTVLLYGPMPKHIAFIMDGNRRYAKSKGVKDGSGHNAGFSALVSILSYCYEMGVKYVTVYAFSIDNFKREPKEVQSLMNLLKEKIEELLKEESIVKEYGIKINFWGDMNLLSEPVRLAAQKAMAATANNRGLVLSVCIAYTSSYEIVNAIEKSCLKKCEMLRKECFVNRNGDLDEEESTKNVISISTLEENMYTADCPNPDIVIRTSGETRLSNFLLWQTSFSHLQNPNVLWPDFSLMNLVSAILKFQKVYHYLEAKRRRAQKYA